MKKKLVCLMMVLALALMLAACGSTKKDGDSEADKKQEESNDKKDDAGNKTDSDKKDTAKTDGKGKISASGEEFLVSMTEGIDKMAECVIAGYYINTLASKANNSGMTDISKISYTFNSMDFAFSNVNQDNTFAEYEEKGWTCLNDGQCVIIVDDNGVVALDTIDDNMSEFSTKYPSFSGINDRFSQLAPFEDELLCEFSDGDNLALSMFSRNYYDDAVKYAFTRHYLNEKIRKGEIKSYMVYTITSAGAFNCLEARIYGDNETIANICAKTFKDQGLSASDYLSAGYEDIKEQVVTKENFSDFDNYVIADSSNCKLSCSIDKEDGKSLVFTFENNSDKYLTIRLFNTTINGSYAATKYNDLIGEAYAGGKTSLKAMCPEGLEEINSISFYYTVWSDKEFENNADGNKVMVEKYKLTSNKADGDNRPECQLVGKNDEIAVSKLSKQEDMRHYSYYVENLTDKTLFITTAGKMFTMISDDGDYTQDNFREYADDYFSVARGLYAINPGCGTVIKVGYDGESYIVDPVSGESSRVHNLKLEDLEFTLGVVYFDEILNVTAYEQLDIYTIDFNFISGLYVKDYVSQN